MPPRNESHSRQAIPAPREICHTVVAIRDSTQPQRSRAPAACFPYRAIRRELDMRIAIMGSGAVGGYFGARLAAGGSDVTFLARGAHLAAMRERGLTVESPLGDIRLAQVKASDNPQTIGPGDLVLVAAKLADTEQAASQVEPLVRAGASVVSFQNGVQKDEILRRFLGEPAVMGGGWYVRAAIEGPGAVQPIRKQQRLAVGGDPRPRSSPP